MNSKNISCAKLTFQMSKTGEEVPIFQEKPLHSLYDPDEEARKFSIKAAEKIQNLKYAIILGLGNGNYIEHLHTISPKLNILIIEPIQELVDRYFQPKTNISIICEHSPETILSNTKLIQFIVQKAPIIIHPGSFQANKMFYQDFLTFKYPNRDFEISGIRYPIGQNVFNGNPTDFLAACLNEICQNSMESI